MATKFFGTSLSDEDFRRIQEAMEVMRFRTNRAFILAALEAIGSKKAVNPEAEKVKIAKEMVFITSIRNRAYTLAIYGTREVCSLAQ
jgi:hypothetical protein